MRRSVIAALLVVAAGVTLFVRTGRDEGPAPDRIVGSVPADALAYVHLDRDTDDWRAAVDALNKLPALQALLLGQAPGVPGSGEAGIASLGGGDPVVITKPRDVRRSLADLPEYADLVGDLPDDRFAHGYVAPGAIPLFRRFDRSLERLAAAASLDGDRLSVAVRARHRGAPGPCVRGRGGDELLSLADPRAALYLEIPSIRCAIRLLAGRIDGAPAVLGRFAELLPLLDSRGALIASPGERAPVFTLVVDDVDEEQALDVLAGLQPDLIDLLGTEELGQAPAFGAVEVEGITAATAQLAPGLELSYAAWDGRLVVSTSLDGVAAVRRAKGLQGGDRFESVLADRPDSASALVFVDLDQLLALGEQAGLAEDPRYLAVRDDLQKLRAAGAVISREGNLTTAELTFQIP